jgi:plasmid stabilization system protein ParE
LRDFIAKENQEAARRAAHELQDGARGLIEHPLIGKPVADLPDYRDLSIRFWASGYILRYRIYEDSIYIVHIRHYRETDFNR